MARNLPRGRKIRLMAALNSNRGMPVWALLKAYGNRGIHGTRRVLNRRKRHWKRKNLKV